MNNSAEIVSAAATAIISAEARVQPDAVRKRRWGSCWSLYWCFGSHKNSKRISHAILVPEAVIPRATVSAVENATPPTAIVLPFIAPPSSPVSFLQSPPSATQSPNGLLSLTVNTYSLGGPSSIFSIGPYAYETQIVSPPVFSAFTTEPSTAPFTPPPESRQLTTPSSPDVPFAQLLASSLDRTRKNFGTNSKFALSHHDFQPYQAYPGSPGGHLISPGSAISNSGTSSPFLDKSPILQLRTGETPSFLVFEHFTTRRWGSRLGSGSLTPDGAGLGSRLGSRLGSGTLTPNGAGLGSRLGSGTLTPDGAGVGSRLSSGSLTPNGLRMDLIPRSGSLMADGLKPASQEGKLLENQISVVASLAKSENELQNYGGVVHHRVSFELTGEEVARCLASKSAGSSRNMSESLIDLSADVQTELSNEKIRSRTPEKDQRETEDPCYQRQRSITLGPAKEFNFEQTEEVLNRPSISSEWWANKKVPSKEPKPSSNWSFFPMLQSGVS